MNQIACLQDRETDPAAFARAYLSHVAEVLGRIDSTAIGAFITALLDARERNARILFLGNGGSAATAGHFANDLTIGTKSWNRPFRALSLTDNVAVVTAVANDYGYEQIFVRQLQTLCEPKDLVVLISASGNSPNIVAAARWAQENGVLTVALTGFDGGRLAGLARISVCVPTEIGEYGPVEDGHMAIDHLVAAYLAAVVRHESQS
jgi:D-sedoheptulose 7-phosphate isomerase